MHLNPAEAKALEDAVVAAGEALVVAEDEVEEEQMLKRLQLPQIQQPKMSLLPLPLPELTS